MKLNRKQLKWLALAIGIIIVSDQFSLYFQNKRIYNKLLNEKINGKIEQIKFSQKGLPFVTVNDTEYCLDLYPLELDSFIRVHDLIVKDSGNFKLKVTQFNRDGTTITKEFNNY